MPDEEKHIKSILPALASIASAMSVCPAIEMAVKDAIIR